VSECDIVSFIRENPGTVALTILRYMLSRMLLWAFFDKLFGLGFETAASNAIINGGSPTHDYLAYYASNGTFGGFFDWLSDYYVLTDILMMLGLLAVGVCLIIGISTKLIVTTFGSLMFLFLYLSVLPLKDNPILDYHLFYIVALHVIYYCDGYRWLSLKEWWCSLEIVKRYPILE
jgi:thiosulfate dehydrogenase [quinone] large subunit